MTNELTVIYLVTNLHIDRVEAFLCLTPSQYINAASILLHLKIWFMEIMFLFPLDSVYPWQKVHQTKPRKTRDSEESKNTLRCNVSIPQDLFTMSELLLSWIQTLRPGYNILIASIQIHFWYGFPNNKDSKSEPNLKQLPIQFERIHHGSTIILVRQFST